MTNFSTGRKVLFILLWLWYTETIFREVVAIYLKAKTTEIRDLKAPVFDSLEPFIERPVCDYTGGFEAELVKKQ